MAQSVQPTVGARKGDEIWPQQLTNPHPYVIDKIGKPSAVLIPEPAIQMIAAATPEALWAKAPAEVRTWPAHPVAINFRAALQSETKALIDLAIVVPDKEGSLNIALFYRNGSTPTRAGTPPPYETCRLEPTADGSWSCRHWLPAGSPPLRTDGREFQRQVIRLVLGVRCLGRLAYINERDHIDSEYVAHIRAEQRIGKMCYDTVSIKKCGNTEIDYKLNTETDLMPRQGELEALFLGGTGAMLQRAPRSVVNSERRIYHRPEIPNETINDLVTVPAVERVRTFVRQTRLEGYKLGSLP